MTVEQIREKIRYGDYLLIAKLSGYARGTVISQLTGRRTLKQPVLDAAIKVIENRSSLFESSK